MTVEDFKVEDGYECPTCEKVLNTSLGLKQHHTKVHDESLVETAQCKWCGDEFHVRPSQVGNFCSKECQMERRKEEGLPARSRRAELECEVCGNTFSVERYDAERGRKYCSSECRKDSWNGEHITCEVCGEEFYAYDTYADEARFCSQDCYGVWLSENRAGENSWNWKGDDRETERPPYGPGMTERVKEQVRDRDGRECAKCGMTEEAHLDEIGEKLHVHHEVNPRESTNPAVHNAPRNLTTLCESCHLSAIHG